MGAEIDLRGLVCPEPVLRTKKLLDDPAFERVVLLVESEVNVKNLERLAGSKSIGMKSDTEDNHFRVHLFRQSDSSIPSSSEIQTSSTSSSEHKVVSSQKSVGEVVFLSKDTFGEGDLEFSKSLLNVFLQTMYESGHRPRALLMANSGVKLMANDSSVKKVLEQFREAGCDVLACGLCVEFYGLKDDIAVEHITNMFSICEYLMTADKVVSP